MDAAQQQQQPAAAPLRTGLGRLRISRPLERVAHLAKEHPTKLLSVLAWASANVLFIVVMLRSSRYGSEQQLLLILSYTTFIFFYTGLYLRRRLRAHAVLRRGLGYYAAGLAAFMSALFFYTSSASGVPLPLAIGAWLLLVVPAAYCFYRVIVIHLDDDEDEAAVQAPAPPQVMRPPPV